MAKTESSHHQSIFSRLTAIMSPAASKREESPEIYDGIYQALYDLLPDHDHPKTWANTLVNMQDDNERKIFSAYEWHAAKIIINAVKPPSTKIKNHDKPPPGKNNTQIVLDHFQEFVRKYNELGRDKKIDAGAVKKLLAEFRVMTREAAKQSQHTPKLK